MIDVALIAPGAYAYTTANRPYQMLIPEPLVYNYNAAYDDWSREPKAGYVLMDNGAWEKPMLATSALLSMMTVRQVDELIVPDSLDDRDATLELLDEFLVDAAYSRDVRPAYLMAVAHGYPDEAKAFVDRVALHRPEVTCIGIGRAYTRYNSAPKARPPLALWIKRNYPHLDVHLLGFNDQWPYEMGACQYEVRSSDTAAPYIAAYYNMELVEASEKDVARPAKYFDIDNLDSGLVAVNIAQLDAIARGEL